MSIAARRPTSIDCQYPAPQFITIENTGPYTGCQESLSEALQKIGVTNYTPDHPTSDKKTSPGVKFADMDLIGIPHRLVISDRGLKENQIEYQERRSQERQDLMADEAVAFIKDTLNV